MADEEIDVRVRLKETAKFHSDSRRAAKDVDQITDSTKRSGKAADDSGKKWGKLSAQLNVLRRVVGLVKPDALIVGLGLATEGAFALAAGGTAAASALAPLGGLLVAYPALASAAGQGLGVFKFAMAGVTDAVGGLTDKMDPEKLAALTPPAQRFAKTLDSMKGPVLGLQRAAQRGLFPGLTNALTTVRPMLKDFHLAVALTGEAIGGLAAQGARMVASGPFSRDLQAQAKTNAMWIGQLGYAGLNLVDALRNVTRAGEPLVSWLVRVAVKLSESVKHWAAAGRASGSLARFFGETRRVTTILARTLFSLTHGLLNVGKAAYPLGLSLLILFQKTAKAFDDWTASVRGRNELRLFFQRARAPLLETFRLIRDVGKGLLVIGTGSEVAPLIRTIRTELLPVFIDLVKHSTKEFGPTLIAFLVQGTKLFAALVGASGPVVLLVELLTSATKALNWMLDNVPGLKPAFVTILGAIAVIKALSWANAIRSVLGLSAAFRRLGVSAGGAAVAEQAAATGGAGGGLRGGVPLGGGLGPAGRAQRQAARIPTRQMPRTGVGQRLSGLSGKLRGAASGAALAAPEIALPVIIAMEIKDITEETTGIHFGPEDILSGRFSKDLGKKLFGVNIKTGPLGIPIGVVRVKAKAQVDPGFTKDLQSLLRRRLRLAGARAATGLAAGLQSHGGRLTLGFRRQIYTQIAGVPRRFRKQAELALIGFAQQMEKSGAVPKGTVRRLIAYLEAQFGKLPADIGGKARRAASQVNLALASIHDTAVQEIPGIGPLLKDQLAGPLATAADAAKDTQNALINLPTRTPHRQHGGTVQTSGLTLVGERGPELAQLSRGTVVTNAQDTRAALRTVHVPSGGDEGPMVIEAHHNIQIGSDTIYRHVSRHAAKVRRKKSGQSE